MVRQSFSKCELRVTALRLPHATFFARSYLLGVGHDSSDNLVEPTPAAGDGSNKREACLRTDRARRPYRRRPASPALRHPRRNQSANRLRRVVIRWTSRLSRLFVG